MASLWRFVSPTTLLFALILFPLPWIEIQCPGFLDSEKTTILKKRPEEKKVPEALQKPTPRLPDWFGRVLQGLGPHKAILFQQSGLQAAIGSWSFGSEVNRESLQTARLSAEMDAGTAPSWLMICYGIVLLIGVAGGYAVRSRHLRCAVIGICAAAALTLTVTERVAGFPLEDAFRHVRWQNVLDDTSKVPPTMDAVLKEDLRYTVWYFLAQGLLIVSLAVTGLEVWLLRKQDKLTAVEPGCLEPPPQPIPEPATA